MKIERETARMQVRAGVHLASRIVAPFWPMRTFVHHNPLHGLEDRPFEEAVREGQRLLGGRGYLPNALFRDYFASGRIRPEHLDAALAPLANEPPVTLGGRDFSHLDLLRAHLVHGMTAPAEETLEAQILRHPHRTLLRDLAARLANPPASSPARSVLPPAGAAHGEGFARLPVSSSARSVLPPAGPRSVMSSAGPEIVSEINREMIKWCEAFFDEGHATWPMPGREKGFYRAWKFLAERELGSSERRRAIADLPDAPEDALIGHLEALGIPPELWQDTLALHLAALPGWAGFVKWRADQDAYDWQQAYPADLVQYLAVRLWYERWQVQAACKDAPGIAENLAQPAGASGTSPRRGRTPSPQAAAWRLVALAQALSIVPSVLMETAPETLWRLVAQLDAFPESVHGPVWLRAFEAGYQERLVAMLKPGLRQNPNLLRHSHESGNPVPTLPSPASGGGLGRGSPGMTDLEDTGPERRYSAQAVFCIDGRSEPFRSHLEAVGDYDTFGFAGFFNLFIRYRAWGRHHDTDQFPVIATAKNMVREVPHSDHEHLLPRHEVVNKLVHAGHTLLHDLKGNVITPYVMVESLGWFYLLPMVAKTFFANLYRTGTTRLRHLFAPPVATTLTVDKGSAEACPLDDCGETEPIPQTGFTLEEQVFAVGTAFRMMGLRTFARLVLFCGHGSVSDNNPYEAALDCGACGGNPGSPNARVLAALANKPAVRDALAQQGLPIPKETWFIAGGHNTTTDAVTLFDPDDVPPTHREDLTRLTEALREAGARNSRERAARFPEIGADLTPKRATSEVQRRSGDWSQVRPEWGLSGNAAFVIGRRDLTRGVHLEGRVFLHSYDHRDDAAGELLAIVMTGPQVVAQWINMEHYFSAVDPETYGSGSKIYHNVAGRFGVMSGPQSDLRTGLARQTVMNGPRPYHEPMRLLTLIEAPRDRIEKIIRQHLVLQHLYDNEWVRLMALDPEEKTFYSYAPKQGWAPFVGHCI